MATPLGDIGKPSAESFRKGRKVFLVPLFTLPKPLAAEDQAPGPEGTEAPARQVDPVEEDLRLLLDRYWTGADEHIARLEARLGKVSRLYHEHLALSGEDGDRLLEHINPSGFTLLRSRIIAGAALEATEEHELVAETADWRACLSLGLVSRKAGTMVYEAYLAATKARYEHIAAQIDRTLKGDESAILVIGDDHRVQFPEDIQVFYVAPPALDELRRWIDQQVRQATSPQR